MENSREVPKKIKNRMPCDPEISFLHIYRKETKTVTQKDILNMNPHIHCSITYNNHDLETT